MKKLVLICFLLRIILYSNAQTHSLRAKIYGFDGNRAYLVQFTGDEQTIIDSTSSLDGVFEIHFTDKLKPGVYRIFLGESGKSNFFNEDPQFFDIIYNNENIHLRTHYAYPLDSMKVLLSRENEILYRFLKANEVFQVKMNRITPLFSVYKQGEAFYSQLLEEFERVQNHFYSFSTNLQMELPGSLAASVIGMQLLPVIEEPGNQYEMKSYVRDHFFDIITMKDERLINSPYITKAILEYLGLFRNPGYDQSKQEDNFILAIENIMEAASGNPVIYDFVLNFLVDGFQRFQMEKVLVYLAENYVEGECETDSKKLLQKRLEGYEKMAIGKKVPDILLPDQNDKQVRLYDLDHDYTLVVFWASWCPHCSSFMKQLNKWYKVKNIDIEVFAVSIDTSRFAWEEQSMIDNYLWINTISNAGWEGKAPKDFNVYATPTLFLLDRERRILAKPLTFNEFKREVELLVEGK